MLLSGQYQALFSLDEVELEFTEDAVREVAKKSFERKTEQEDSAQYLNLL